MQQTTTYKLNLIEKDDVFSPDALNANTQKVEQVLHTFITGEEEARENADTALAVRVTALEAHKFVIGAYTGNCTENHSGRQVIELGFTPLAVIIHSKGSSIQMPFAEGYDSYSSIVENGFQVYYSADTRAGYNVNGTVYRYIAFV